MPIETKNKTNRRHDCTHNAATGSKRGRKARPSVPQETKQTAWAYYRVSTLEQDLDRQRLEVLNYANKNALHISREVECKVSSRKDGKERQIDMLRAAAVEGELTQLIFSELSRLGRSTGEICRLVDFFVHEHGVVLHFIKEGMVLRGGKMDISSKVLLSTFSLLAEIERDLISERTKDGLAAARAKGVRLGRPKGKSKLDQYEKEIRDLLEIGVKQKAIAKRYDFTEITLCRWLKHKRPLWTKEHEKT